MPPPVSPVDPALSRTFTITLQADYTQLAANPSTLSRFRSDFVTAIANSLSLQTSQVQILGLGTGSIIITAVASVSNSSSLAALDAALLSLQAAPTQALGSAFLTSYAATSASVSVSLPPSPPPPSPPLPSPLGPPSLACAASSLGYACSLATEFVTVHWTVGGTAPTNECTATTTTSTSNSSSSSASSSASAASGMLHMALESGSTGYVSLGFADPGSADIRMFPSDVVLGYVASTGQSMVNTWSLADSYYYVSASNAASPTWTTARGITQQGGATTLCFSRPLSASAASVSSSISTGATVNLIWAVADNGVTDVTVTHSYRGAVSVNFGTGAAEAVSPHRRLVYLNIHGATMLVAWVLLIPLGTLMARHKWVLDSHKSCGLHTWFQVHLFLQLSGTVLLVVGMVHAWVYFDRQTAGGSVGQAHADMGTSVLVCTGLQILMTLVRPSPDAPRRALWNHLHHNLGRLTLLSAWASVYLGVYIAHESPVYQASYMVWLVPTMLVMGCMMTADVVLSMLARTTKRREAREQQQKQQLPAHTLDPSAGTEMCMPPATTAARGPSPQCGSSGSSREPRASFGAEGAFKTVP